MSAIDILVTGVRKSFQNSEFDKFIHDVTFPKFKNFAPGSKIEFRFPVTILIGPNGGGKSSVLQAAWGMPLDHSTSRFWFSTPVDPIENSSGNHRYWYSHYVKALGQIVQCRKTSGAKRNGYWEPARPSLGEGMSKMPAMNAKLAPFASASGDRWNQVSRDSHYLNSKAESSAFDRFFYSSSKTTLDAKQNYFIRYSNQLKRAISKKLNSLIYYGVERIEKNFLIPDDKLKIINDILQKKYKSARYIVHSLYDRNFSPSVIFETEKINYSECFAGSGELAVVNTVLALDVLKEYDLLLLDEPETSLHPGAQTKLIEHLLKIVKEKKIQVIISTHSPTFVDLLPTEALVVLDETPAGVTVRADATKSSAFHRLGHLDKSKITLLTEDPLIKAIVERAVQQLPKDLIRKVVVESAEVGASEMLSNQTKAYILANSKVVMVLDGDQAPIAKIYSKDLNGMSLKDKEDAEADLKKLHVSLVGSVSDFDSWATWCKSHVVLLEQICAEAVLLQALNPTHPLLQEKDATNKKFKAAVKKVLYETGNEFDSLAQYNILKFKLGELPKTDPVVQSIKRLAKNLEKQIKAIEE